MRISDWSSDVCSSDLGFWSPAHGTLWLALYLHVIDGMMKCAAGEMAIQHYIRDNLRSYIDGKSIPVRSKNGEGLCDLLIRINGADCPRSEEHTSELQSLMRNSYAVFCLQKTNKHNKLHINNQTKYNLTR